MRNQNYTIISSTSKEFTDAQTVTAYINMINILQYWKERFNRNSVDSKGMLIRVAANQELKNSTCFVISLS